MYGVAEECSIIRWTLALLSNLAELQHLEQVCPRNIGLWFKNSQRFGVCACVLHQAKVRPTAALLPPTFVG